MYKYIYKQVNLIFLIAYYFLGILHKLFLIKKKNSTYKFNKIFTLPIK